MQSNNPIRFTLSYGLGRRIAGFATAGAIAAILVAAFWSMQRVALAPRAGVHIDILHLIRMSAIQAGLTMLISMLVGIALAWALNRLSFPGRSLVVSLFAAAIVMPGLVIAMGLLTVWGRAGWINAILHPFGFDLGSSIFGLHGILLAHVILDATFAARILLGRLDSITATRLKTGQSLGLDPWQRFKTIDWPAISNAIPGVSAIIFLLAFTSFPIVLLLGGGPANQTLEVAIYSEVRLNFNLGNAVSLALTQLAICAAIILPALSTRTSIAPAGTRRHYHWREPMGIVVLQIAITAIAFLCFASPLLAVLIPGLGANIIPIIQSASFGRAVVTSMIIGTASALTTFVIALTLSRAQAAAKSRLTRMIFSLPAYVILAVPAVVLSLGFFIGVRDLKLSQQLAAPVILVIANTLLALPFAISTLAPALHAIETRYQKLCRALNVTGFERWRLVEWPLLGRDIGIALALGFCFSLGDLGVISLFGTDDFTTLTWQMYRSMGAYRSDDAAFIAALLLVISLSVFWLVPALLEKLSNAHD